MPVQRALPQHAAAIAHDAEPFVRIGEDADGIAFLLTPALALEVVPCLRCLSEGERCAWEIHGETSQRLGESRDEGIRRARIGLLDEHVLRRETALLVEQRDLAGGDRRRTGVRRLAADQRDTQARTEAQQAPRRMCGEGVNALLAPVGEYHAGARGDECLMRPAAAGPMHHRERCGETWIDGKEGL